MKYFNTEGPVNLQEMYKIDPLKRWDLNEVLDLIEKKKYFIVHAPRQTGKTSCLLALRDYLNAEGKYYAIYLNVETGQAARHAVARAVKSIVVNLKDELLCAKVDEAIYSKLIPTFAESDAESGLKSVLMYLSTHMPKPIVLLVDEIDALVGDSLVSVLRQLRAGYEKRPSEYPSSIVLCGLRDVKDYRIHTSGQEIITGGSAFNIKAASLRLGDFNEEEVIELYSQHTTETGQKFANGCIERVMQYTNGQPWLVNALALEVTHKMKENRDRNVVITPKMIDIAKENIILSRQTHLDQLADKLKEDRVRRVVEPIMLGEYIDEKEQADDLEYCIDLGLVKKIEGIYDISNRIYKEVIPRELTQMVQRVFTTQFTGGWLTRDGSIDVTKLLTMFKKFWLENAKIWGPKMSGYVEAAPHLVIQAFLQRVINHHGDIHREYALGRSRFDIFIERDFKNKAGIEETQRFVIELKTITAGQKYETLKKQAMQQTATYAKVCKSNETAHIVFFNRGLKKGWNTKEKNEQVEHNGVKMVVWKM